MIAISRMLLPLLSCMSLIGSAELILPAIISDHMVLQRSSATRVWGRSAPGDRIQVEIAGCAAAAVAGADGTWRTTLDLGKAARGPHELLVAGKERIVVHDVMIGEVWIASGQSNMEFRLPRAMDAEQELSGAGNPLLRQFTIKRRQSETPVEKGEGSWVVASTGSARHFSALGYFFGKEVQQSLDAPVGLVCAAVGDTPVEAWMSYDALAQDPDLKQATDRDLRMSRSYPEDRKAYIAAYRAWEQTWQRQDHADPAAVSAMSDFTGSDGWKAVKLPGKLSDAGLPDAGAVWLVRSFDLNATMAGKDWPISMGNPNGLEAVYWNGREIGRRTLENMRGEGEGRSYVIPGAQIQPGRNVLAMRLFNPVGGLAVTGKMAQPGDWAAKMESSLPVLSEAARAAVPPALAVPPDPKKTGSLLFNGMINPIVPFSMRGVIWYQGETNAVRAVQYGTTFPRLIADWRQRWGDGDFPFYFCQLANYHAKRTEPGDNAWAELREAQGKALALPATGQAVLIDIGEAGDIHPRNKRDAGKRLAALALARTYGRAVPYSGPQFASASKEGKAIRVRFTHTDGGLVATALPATFWLESKSNQTVPLVRNSPDSQLEGFALAGSDRRWVWANARIDGDSVVVESPQLAAPEFVRYAWAQNPTCNLANGSGLPTSPFRSDDFPGLTQDVKY